MNKYTYKTDFTKTEKTNQIIILDDKRYKEIQDFLPKKRKTMSKIFGDIFEFLQEITSLNNISRILIPLTFIVLGLFIIYRQVFPEIQQTIAQNAGYLDQINIVPVAEEFIVWKSFISKVENFQELTEKAFEEDVLQTDNISFEYKGDFRISIPAIGINNLIVEANVDSTSESIYNRVLDTKLAHFKGTGLPISNVKNNIVVYGHSISLNYNPIRSNPMVAFTFLPEVKIGDEIILDINNQSYKFIVQQTKVVDPNDVSIITGKRGKRTLTLFTCFPLGNNTQRFVVVAREVK